MKADDLVTRAVAVFVNNPTADFETLRAALVSDGMSQAEAAAVLEFVPLAFGRAFLNGMGIEFPNYYVRVDANGKEVERKQLVQEPLYLFASMQAPLVMMLQGQEAFTAIATRSAEVDAVNNALNAGADPAGLVAAPPTMMAGSTGASGESKPWWKFW